jgi:hypothetical protein
MAHVVVPAREHVVVQRSSRALQPRPRCFPGRVHQLELDRPLRLLLHDDSQIAHTPIRHDIADQRADDVAAAQLAVDRKAEQCPGAQTPVLIEPEAYRPELLLLQRAFGAQQASPIPRPALLVGGVQWRVAHRSSPWS